MENFVSMATQSFPVPTHLLNKATNIFICLLDHVFEAPFANKKMERQRRPEMPLILERSGTQYLPW